MKIVYLVFFILTISSCSLLQERKPTNTVEEITRRAKVVVNRYFKSVSAGNMRLRFELEQPISMTCSDGGLETYTFLTVYNDSKIKDLKENDVVELKTWTDRIECPEFADQGMDNIIAQSLEVIPVVEIPAK